jgi:DNA-binding transcriptional MerR regulator
MTYYTIGEAGKICNISGKTLRYYEKIGLISPDMIGENDYRYYSRETLLTIPVIKYYKQMGFTLREMRDLVNGSPYKKIEQNFREKLSALERERQSLLDQEAMLKDWYDLIVEGSVVMESGASEPCLKYFEPARYCMFEQPYNPDYRDAIINIEFTNFLEQIENEVVGPVIRSFNSFREKMAGECKFMRILQQTIRACPEDVSVNYRGGMMLACYHIGAHERLNETYEKMIRWADEHGCNCSGGAHERYIVDYWTTNEESHFVTEVALEISY